MTLAASDPLFLRLVMACRTVDEALLLWWLIAVRADEYTYRSSSRQLVRSLGGAFDHKTCLRALDRLAGEGVLSLRKVNRAFLQIALDSARVRTMLGQCDAMGSDCALRHIDPMRHGRVAGLAAATAWSRVALHRRSREQVLLLAWLFHSGADASPLHVSSRSIEAAVGVRMDRRTALRAMSRLADDGLIDVSRGSAGAFYRLHEGLVIDLVHKPFPFDGDAVATMPGWADLSLSWHEADEQAATRPAHNAPCEDVELIA